VLHRGNFHFRGFNDLNEGDERWLSQVDLAETGGISGQCLAAIKHLSDMGEQILIFISTRKNSVGLAEILAQNLDLPPAARALDSLRDCPPSLQNEMLERCLRKGIAFHHADLDEHQRELLENGFRSGEIRILTSTSTLASGVNLPAKNVFIEAFKYGGAKSAHCRETLTPLTGVDFNQAAGRAGRLGSKQSFGRAIMTASTPFEQEVLWDKYIYGRCEDPAPGLSIEQIPELILRLISCGAASRPDDLESLCRSTYSTTNDEFANSISTEIFKTLEQFEKSNFAHIKSWGKIEPTHLGKAISAAAISVKSAITICERLLEFKETPTPLDCLLLSLGLDEWLDEAGGFRLSGQPSDTALYKISEIIRDTFDIQSPRIDKVLQDYHELKMVSSIAGFLISLEWISGKPTCEIEMEFDKGAGGLKRDSGTICWLLRAVDKIARASSLPVSHNQEAIPELETLISRLQYGVDDKMLPLAVTIGIDREFIRRIYTNGIISPAYLYDADLGMLASILPVKVVAKIEKWKQGYGVKSTKIEMNQPIPIRIVFSGRQDKQKNEVTIDGQSLFLQPRLYSYIQRLYNAYLDKTLWVHKDHLDIGVNQARYISKLRRILSDSGIELEIESNGRGSYALKFPEVPVNKLAS